jgi:hypothetical protein
LRSTIVQQGLLRARPMRQQCLHEGDHIAILSGANCPPPHRGLPMGIRWCRWRDEPCVDSVVFSYFQHYGNP